MIRKPARFIFMGRVKGICIQKIIKNNLAEAILQKNNLADVLSFQGSCSFTRTLIHTAVERDNLPKTWLDISSYREGHTVTLLLLNETDIRLISSVVIRYRLSRSLRFSLFFTYRGNQTLKCYSITWLYSAAHSAESSVNTVGVN